MRPGITGVRDQLWLLAHDERYTPLRLMIDVRALNIGLVAATLTDLLLADRIHIAAGRIYITDESRELVPDPVGAAIQIAIGAAHAPLLTSVLRGARADWYGDEPNPYQEVYQRTRAVLIAAGHLREERRRLRSSCYHLRNQELISTIRGRLNHRLVYLDRPADATTDCLCALILSLRLHGSLMTPYDAAEIEHILSGITNSIPLRAGKESPLLAVPDLAQAVSDTIGDLATAPF
ncbi:GPP34 family phosphoprotein [Paractinoplanes rishiriensis]|uniref:Uncharacterized protein n=1 Tax=Paractinoplanes rishiriensis TaxID=1050105 RepID=A0A919MT48_9ACTN|nr:GPP34 family phosphoprotein [Actinoplanes rishiriensis]GIE93879.1 hypothetical protein Ari01nite_13440 [Actinoplanes rishiriensis]